MRYLILSPDAQRGCEVSSSEIFKRHLDVFPSNFLQLALLEQQLDQMASRGYCHPQPFCDSSFFFPVPALFLTNTCIILIKFETYFACCLIACGGTSCTILLLVVLCGSLIDADGSAGPVEGFLWLGMPSQGSRSDSWPRGAALVHGT